MVHGGLWRAGPVSDARKRRKALRLPLVVGSLQDLRAAFKGGPDPSGRGKTVTSADATWSDPVAEPGLRRNVARGVGLVFGPDVTEVIHVLANDTLNVGRECIKCSQGEIL